MISINTWCNTYRSVSSGVSVIEKSYASLKKDVVEFKQKGRVEVLGEFNAGGDRFTYVDGVIGIQTCNAGNLSLSWTR